MTDAERIAEMKQVNIRLLKRAKEAEASLAAVVKALEAAQELAAKHDAELEYGFKHVLTNLPARSLAIQDVLEAAKAETELHIVGCGADGMPYETTCICHLCQAVGALK